METKYKIERAAFERLRDKSSTQARTEYENAVNATVRIYNTGARDNRFLAGGVIDVLTLAFLRSAGIKGELHEEEVRHRGIRLQGSNKTLGINGSYNGGAQRIVLINKQGKGRREWDNPNLFVLADVGIVFAAYDLLSEDCLYDGDKQLALKKSAVQTLINSPANVFRLDIAKKPPLKNEDIYAAHKMHTHTIVKKIGATTLAKNLDPPPPL